MRRRKVLVVCMFDSIHSARWLSQFVDQDIDFILFPSKRFKKTHPKIVELFQLNGTATFTAALPIKITDVFGYLDFILFELIPKYFGENLRALYLRRLITKNTFDFVHALEIQGAGYLCDKAIKNKTFTFILTNWGSDIFYFQHLDDHLPRIKSTLEKADLYSAECKRDYILAKKLGFKGRELPCIPNGGGLIGHEVLRIGIPTSSRKNIVVKAYGGTFGRGALAVTAVEEVMEKYPDLTAYFYSVTSDLLESVLSLKTKFGTRIGYATLKNPISFEALNSIFLSSRIYVGCSVSDGISTSFLEALIAGVYPVQTNTSCAGEWIDKGIIASCINLSEIGNELHRVIKLNKELDKASINNLEIANKELRRDFIKAEALKFYE